MWLGTLAHTSEPGMSLIHKMWFALLGGTLSLALRPIYRRLHNRGVGISRLVAASAVCSYLLTVVWGAGYRTGVRLIEAAITGSAVNWPSTAALFGGTLFFSFIMMAWSVLYFGVKYYRDVETERARALAAESEAHRAELQALRYQLNPHFLFNTMNAISTLIVEGRDRDAERMVTRLSDFLRLTLEVDFAERYLEIEKIRFGDRLQSTVDISPDVLSAQVPALLLQPLVENAVRHGITPREEGGHLRIEGRRAGNRLLLRVADDGVGLSDTDDTCSSGVGLSNTRARLDALYGDDASFRIERSDGGGCAVVIDIPYHEDASTR